MKKAFFLAAGIAAAIAGLTACNKDLTPDVVLPQNQEELGTLSFEIMPAEDVAVTKAVSAYTTAQTYEAQVNKVQILVFGSDGAINFYKNLGSSTSGSISTTAGTKTVWAVVNGPDLSSVGTLSALQATAVDLSANSTTASTGFVMAGSSTCTVSSGATASCAVTVSRLASRVALTSVVNNLPSSYGAITINRVFLSNVVGNQNLAGSASASTWYNKNGRADESTRNTAHIIDGSTYKASCEALTYKGVVSSLANGGTYSPSTPLLFYSYPNSSTTAPAGFQSTFAAQRSVLVVVATISGTTYYYPVVLDDAVLARNTAYTVGLTITGLGSSDPNTPVTKGSISASVTVSGWSSGATYDETI